MTPEAEAAHPSDEQVRRAIYSVWPGLAQDDTRRLVAAIRPILEREAAHRDSLSCAKCGSTNVYTQHQAAVGKMRERMEHRCRNCRHSWYADPLDVLATQPAPPSDPSGDRDSQIAALLSVAESLYTTHERAVEGIERWLNVIDAAGLRLDRSTPPATIPSLDVETLARAIEAAMASPGYGKIGLASMVAAEYERLRASTIPDTTET